MTHRGHFLYETAEADKIDITAMYNEALEKLNELEFESGQIFDLKEVEENVFVALLEDFKKGLSLRKIKENFATNIGAKNKRGKIILIKELKTVIWDREFTLPIVYDCYKGEVVTEEQVAAVRNFVNNPQWVVKSKGMVESFCHDDLINDPNNQKKNNIFSYVVPESIFVKRDDSNPRVAIMCKYRYDMEHGLAVVFSHDGNIKVGLQDIIL